MGEYATHQSEGVPPDGRAADAGSPEYYRRLRPSLLIRDGRVIVANRAARSLLGFRAEGNDVRLALRHPQALEAIQSGRAARLELAGIGEPGRPWEVIVQPLDNGDQLVRLADRSAARAAERMRVDFVAN